MRTFLLTIFSFILVSASAQIPANLKFDKLSHDFGTVKEENGPITHEFIFTNTGDKPVTIAKVNASCGCTTPGWTKEAVEPGAQGYVQAQYNTTNRPGSFNKSLTVYTDQDNEIKLYIRGNVVPRPKSIEEKLPTAMGNIRTKYSSFNMGKVLTTDEPSAKDFDIYNAGDEPVVIKELRHPDHVKIEIMDTLLPGKTEVMTIMYDAKAKGDLGFFSENITLVTDEIYDSLKSYSLFINIEEYFPTMSREEFLKAPRLSFGEQIYDFDRTKEGETIVNEFQLMNNGQSVLNIRKIASNCSCLKVELMKNDLNPGESTTIKAELNTEGRKGNQQKAITVYSNDPSAPVQRLTIKGYVESGD